MESKKKKKVIVGITPARGGSKGIPYKNIKPLCGKPLLAWTIERARESRLLDDYFVSTEDSRIADTARQHGAKVLERPARLALDTTSTLAVLQHAFTCVKADIVVVLQATSPVRDAGLIDRCIERFIKTNVDSLATGFVCKYVPYGTNNKPRQKLNGFFYDDGNVYVIRASLIQKGDRYGRKQEQILLDKEQNIDIDDGFDFWLAEQVLRKRGHHA